MQQDIQHMKQAFFSLPIAEKEAVFREMEFNLLQAIYEQGLREDLEIVNKRFAQVDAGNERTFSSEEVMREVFGQ